MTAALLNETATVRDLLFAAGLVEPTDAVAESLHEQGTVGSLVTGFPGLRAAVEREVATEANGLLSLNLLDLAVAGWNRYDELRKAALRTRDAPTAEELVALVTHRIESNHRPTVEVFVNGNSTGTVEMELDVAFEMAGVVAVVRQGRLMAIRSGNCTVTGKLAIERAVVAQRHHRFDLPGAVQLRHGVPLLEPAATVAPVEHAVVGEAQSPPAPAAWYPDPVGRYEFRWWDGARWIHQVASQGRVMSDPVG